MKFVTASLLIVLMPFLHQIQAKNGTSPTADASFKFSPQVELWMSLANLFQKRIFIMHEDHSSMATKSSIDQAKQLSR